jgi:Ni/Co efflux regulator RcnB
MLKLILSAGVVAFLGIAPASAAPASAAGASAIQNSEGLVQEVQYRRDRHRHNSHRRRGPSHRYAPGSRHRAAPHGWRRFHHRPRDWRTRGCILVGPLWFCP